MLSLEDQIKAQIRDVPDFPKPGIVFKDITPVLQNPEMLRLVIDHLADHYKDQNIDVLVGIESRGFIFGTALAYAMGKGISLVRKPGKLPWKKQSQTYTLEYGEDTLEIHEDAVADGARVLVVDDLLATGGTAEATCSLIEKVGGTVAGCAFLIELEFLEGRKRLTQHKPYALVHY